ncbi:hypothetical protein [Desulfonema magnum]|uniref:Uncharacterized protein n=1 Tax=Desulfonema magnum TaxID=45655 RepID=A0A975BNR5_9BACT|nr:hypothetical protein [Desulfonema magnum]QTA88835.1 Uncharacterized protein dnm_048820 [Desulfonema magnum]
MFHGKNYSDGKWKVMCQEISDDANLSLTQIHSGLTHKQAIELAYRKNKEDGTRETEAFCPIDRKDYKIISVYYVEKDK